jgi:L-iditol 2-dehydrogenase
MTVSLWYNNKDIRLKEEPVPKPGPGEALLKIVVCGLCGSDLVEWYRLPRAPLVQGHEIGAIIESVGPGVTKVKPGDRVFVAPKIPCMECFYCKNGHYPQCTKIKERLPGGFSQYVLVSPRLLDMGLYVLPDTVTLDQATLIGFRTASYPAGGSERMPHRGC